MKCATPHPGRVSRLLAPVFRQMRGVQWCNPRTAAVTHGKLGPGNKVLPSQPSGIPNECRIGAPGSAAASWAKASLAL